MSDKSYSEKLKGISATGGGGLQIEKDYFTRQDVKTNLAIVQESISKYRRFFELNKKKNESKSHMTIKKG